MRRTVSAPPTAAVSMTDRPRRTTSMFWSVLAHELRVAEDGLEQVVEVVGDAARDLTEGGELLRLVHLRLELALRGHVADDGEQAFHPALASGHAGEGHGQVQHLPIRPLGAQVEGAGRPHAGEGLARRLLVLVGEHAP